LKLVEILLKNYNYKIIGLKIICLGRWKKTSTGRKQKLFLKFGQVKSSDISNKIIYQTISQTTKFGVCSIKIWIAQKL
jgi:ribosomal protein S3